MIDSRTTRCPCSSLGSSAVFSLAAGLWLFAATLNAQPQPTPPPGQALTATPFVYQVQQTNERLQMTINTSRLLTLDEKIPQVQVNNPDILDVTPMSPTQIQISAKRTGVTQVNLWTEKKQIHTVDVVVLGDARELAFILKSKFPKTNIEVTPIGGAVMLQGFVDEQSAVPTIHAIAQQYFPQIIDSMVVSGVQQTNLHVKVVEVSRSKMRQMGFDFSHTNGGNLFMSGVSGLLSSSNTFGAPTGAPDGALKFAVLPNGGQTAFYGVLQALRTDNLGKIMSEPDLVAISGRPAYILVGGEIGYQTSSGLTGNVVGFKEYGTRLDFVPIVLGNGRIHLDIKSRVSQPDAANSVGGIPALATRETETGVEMRSGQTFAIAGLVEYRDEATNTGLPWVSELPYVGAAFRNVSHSINEVELLVLVTPELVDPMDPGQVPTCLPGMSTAPPSDWELFMKGHLEVPNCNNGSCALDHGAAVASGNPANTMPVQAAPVQDVNAAQQQKPYDPPKPTVAGRNSLPPEPGFIGPIGYEYVK
jgi:pilus assembly protein CpaC